jgi:hypothetical protein
VPTAANVTTTDVAIYLGIYASIVSTAAGLWALFSGVFRDRARITINASESYLVKTVKGPMLVRGEDTLETVGATTEQATEVLSLVVRNRGRRACRIEAVAQMGRTGSTLFADLAGQVPFDLPPESSKTLVIGADGGYNHGDNEQRWFYVVDGAGRKHPLRERYGERIALMLGGWAIRLYIKRRRLRQQGRTRG